MEHYSNQLTIRRVSGAPLDLESCYINLAIVEANNQRKEDENNLKQQEKFIRIPSYESISSTNTEKLIPIENILDKHDLCKAKERIPKRVLIIGRAGVGKTTLCKKLIHIFQKGQWNDRFDSVLWLPLRLLKSFKSRTLEDLLLEKYFTEGAENKRKGLVHEFIKIAENGRILFILDGLDEFVTGIDTEHGDPLQCFVTTLLKQPNIIITTRPYGNDRSLLRDIDLELETVGFSSENVKRYVKSIFTDPVHSASVMDFIDNTPLIQGLVNIPIQLDLVCFSWSDLVASKESVTITQLYQTIVKKLWCSDAIRMRKEIGGKLATENLFNNLRKAAINSNMAPMVEFLGYLAFRGLKDGHQLVFDHATLLMRDDELYQHRLDTNQPGLPEGFLDEVKKSSILHKPETEATTNLGTPVETWNFIHLTFQEYFAATWLSRYFGGEQHISSIRSSLMDFDETMEFIRLNKYNPRYEIVWWMIAGQLSGEALSSYFDLLQQEPRDLIGPRHQLLIAGCYKESQSQLAENYTDQIQDELAQWFSLELKLLDNLDRRPFDKFDMFCYGIHDKDDISKIGKQSVIPNEILIKSLGVSKKYNSIIFKTLRHRKYVLNDSAEEGLVELIKNTNSVSTKYAVLLLGYQHTLSDLTASTIATTLQHDDDEVRIIACTVLGRQSKLSNSILPLILNALKDDNFIVREEAAYALWNQSTLSDSTISALAITLQDESPSVSEAAAAALVHQSTLSDSSISALITALQHKFEDVRDVTACGLVKRFILSDPVISILIAALQNDDCNVRFSVAHSLQYQSALSDFITAALVTALQDVNPYVRRAVANTLESQLTLSDCTTSALLTALQDENMDVSEAVARALGSRSMSDSTILALVSALQDNRPFFRKAAVSVFSYQSILSEYTISVLVTALKDEDSSVRNAAVSALGRQSTLPDFVILAIVTALQDKDKHVRVTAANALWKQSPLPDPAILALVSALWDECSDVSRAAASTIGNQSTLPAPVLSVLVTALRDNKSYIRRAAANALAIRSTLPDTIITALVIALQDEDIDVRYAVANALKTQSILPASTISALVTALQDEDRYVQSTLPTSSTSSFDLDSAAESIKSAVVESLGKESALPDPVILELVTALQNKHFLVRKAAANALGKQSRLSETTMVQIISSMKRIDEVYLLDAIGLWRMCSFLQFLNTDEIENFYKNCLFHHSCDHHSSLFIYKNRLQGFSEQGFNRSDELSPKDLEKIKSDFISIQKKYGIADPK